MASFFSLHILCHLFPASNHENLTLTKTTVCLCVCLAANSKLIIYIRKCALRDSLLYAFTQRSNEARILLSHFYLQSNIFIFFLLSHSFLIQRVFCFSPCLCKPFDFMLANCVNNVRIVFVFRCLPLPGCAFVGCLTGYLQGHATWMLFCCLFSS